MIVFFVLAVLTIVSVSFLYRMRLEGEAVSNYCDALQAEYLAWAGIERAIAELKNDDNHYDDLYEDWARGFREELGAGYYDVQLISDEGELRDVGVGIVDEGSKLNINVAGDGRFKEGWNPFGLSLDVLDGVGKEKASAIVNYRYGPDKVPGKKKVDADIFTKDGIENGVDGRIDAQVKFGAHSSFEYGKPFVTLEQVRLVPGIGEHTFDKIKDEITIYSYDKNIDREGNLRVNMNYASAPEIARAVERAGFSPEEAAQIAVNIVDFRDEDDDPTEYRGKYGIEITPYINEVMPFFTTSAMVAVTNLAKGGVKYVKDRAKEELENTVKEKVKIDIPGLDNILDEFLSAGEAELEKEVDRIIDRFESLIGSEKQEDKLSLFSLLTTKPAFAAEDAVKIDIQIEWVELYNPYSCTISLLGWKLKTSLGERKIFGVTTPQGYWVVFNVIVKLPGKTIGKELLSNFSDTVQLINKNGKVVDKVSYNNYGVPWRAWEKNDPRVREFAGYMIGGSPWFRNWHYMPRIGEVSPEQAPSSFYVKNSYFDLVGEVGYIHSGKQWRTISLDKGGDWAILDKLTTASPPEEPVQGRININTASRKVLESLPGIDAKLAEQIVRYCDSEKGPFEEIGEIVEVIGMQMLGSNGLDDDGDGYVDEDDEKEAIVRGLSNLITVRSNCFTIVSLGRVVRNEKVVAEKKLQVVVDRGSSPIKIKYYREIYK
ncbi:helix-hairpin-helix domain-containing protein [Candidatus Aerophobetes bacterium]|nr:helix-hairpin-helix domain-containing protein [Candidatus Aerophobetes bacterium]